MFGISMGMLFPLAVLGILAGIGYLWTNYLGVGRPPLLRERTLALLAICAALIPFQGFRKARANESMRGVVLVTVILGILWVVLYARELLD